MTECSYGDTDKAFLGPVDQNGSSSWSIGVTVNTPMTFKIDTGAEVTTISQCSLRRLGSIRLLKPLKTLYGPAGERLSVEGQFQATFRHGNQECIETVFVVNGLKANLPAITQLS